MEQLNQAAQNIVKILSDWKVENDKYKAKIDQFQDGMDAQAATLQNFINSNLAMQSSATKNAEKASGKKRSRVQASDQNESDAVQSKRLKNNDAESATTSSGDATDKITADPKRVPKPFVIISPMNIKKEKNEKLVVVNRRAAGMVAVALNTGKLRKNPSEATGAINIPTRTTRHQNSKAQNQSLAMLLAQTSAQAMVVKAQPSNKENDSWSKGMPVTSTPNVVDVPKKTVAAKAVASKNKQVAEKAMKPGKILTQTAPGRVLTRRASKL